MCEVQLPFAPLEFVSQIVVHVHELSRICVDAENDIDLYPLLSLPDFCVSSCFASNRQQLLPIFLLC